MRRGRARTSTPQAVETRWQHAQRDAIAARNPTPQRDETSEPHVPSIGVIVSVSNSATYVEKVFTGLSCQERLPDEVIVADDGSTDSTPEVVAAAGAAGHFPISYLWQEKQGFRKCRILNRAIASAKAEYLIFLDGDCVPRRDFIAAHGRRAAAGRFLSGGVFRLPRPLSQSVERSDIADGRLFERGWLQAQGVRVPFTSKVGAPGWAAHFLSKATTTRATFNGHNSSAWRDDVVRVNGFDERMVYGGLDREFGERLENAGVRGYGIRYEAVCVHLDHDRTYIDKAGWEANDALRKETRRSRSIWTDFGIVRKSDTTPAS
jgi:glycosyltransferase involved in cell wall biosynthesis